MNSWLDSLLSEHETLIKRYILRLGILPGFPTDPEQIENTARAWAKFADTEPHKVKPPKRMAAHWSEEDLKREMAPFMWRDGLIPIQWLIETVLRDCEFMPAPKVAREIYCKAGFPPLDGFWPAISAPSNIGLEID